MAEANVTTRLCKLCNNSLPLSYFYEKNGKPASKTCKECTKSKLRSMYLENPNYYKNNAGRWKLKNKERKRLLNRRWREINRPKHVASCKSYRETNRNKVRMQSLAWYYRNAYRTRDTNAKRRASELNATPVWANKDKILAFYEIARSIEIETGIRQSVDHIVPLRNKIVCGLHCEHNLQVIPLTDNLVKGNRYWPDMP